MTRKLLFIFCLIIGVSSIAFGQRSVTNSNLEHYRQDRMRAMREDRANRARLGLPSPEEIAVRDEQSRMESLELADKLRAQRLERERMSVELQRVAADIERARLEAAAAYYHSTGSGAAYDGGGFYGGFGGGFIGSGYYPGLGDQFDRRRRFGRRGFAGQTGYFAGGQFWPQGPRTRSRPLISTPRRRR